MPKIKKIGILTSGGDSPGMNAAIRSVVRSAIFNGLEPFGIKYGYQGLIDNEIEAITTYDVRNIIQRGGTVLKTSRCKEFHTKKGREKAYKNLQNCKIDALVVIGGDGTFEGANIFSKEHDIPTVGLPGTIDNDLYGTDFTIGFDTALNTIVQAVDKIKETASSHGRLFFVEVMGRDAGFIAIRSGIACGAEFVMIPEIKNQENQLIEHLTRKGRRKKQSSVILVAEGNHPDGVFKLVENIKEKLPGYRIRANVLGHMQRGGSPSAFDRFLASRLGVGAVEALLDNQRSIMIGYVEHELVHIPFNKTVKSYRSMSKELIKVAEVLSV